MPAYIHSDRGSSLISEELKNFLHSKGIATSRTTPYNPRGNGQVERYNGIIWKAITLALKSKGLHTKQWELVLPGSLHSIRSLLCTATNVTPHERFFSYQRRSVCGQSVPTWLTDSDKVFVRRHAKNSKFDPCVEEADLIEANPQYAHVRFSNGRETTVSIKDLAPCGKLPCRTDEVETIVRNTDPALGDIAPALPIEPVVPNSSLNLPDGSQNVSERKPDSTFETPVLRRSERTRKPPSRYASED